MDKEWISVFFKNLRTSNYLFFGPLAKLLKATISFMSVCLSVCPSACVSAWNISPPTGEILMKLVFEIFLRICGENLNLNKI
jgi:hypothetical protein